MKPSFLFPNPIIPYHPFTFSLRQKVVEGKKNNDKDSNENKNKNLWSQRAKSSNKKKNKNYLWM